MLPSIEQLITVTPEIERVLGKTAAQIRRMTVRELADAAFEKGFEWRVSVDGCQPGLTIKVARCTGNDPVSPP